MALLFVLPFPGTVALRLLCLVVAFLVAIFLWRRLAPPSIPCKPALISWALIAVISLAGAVDPLYSLGEIKNEIFYTMMAFVAFFAITREEDDLKQLLIPMLIGAVVICGWALETRLRLGVWQERGNYGGVGAFPGYAAVLVPMLFLFRAYTPVRSYRMAILALWVVIVADGIVSLERIVLWIIALQAAIALVLLRRGRLINLSPIRLLAVLVGIVALAGGLFLVVQQERVKISKASAIAEDSRLAQWPAILGRIAENPIRGSGFGREVMKKAHSDLIPKTNPMLWHAHNVFLNYGLGMGVLGILVLTWVFFSLSREYWRFCNSPDDKLKLIGIAGLMLTAGVVLRNLVSDEFVRDAAILFWAMNGMLLGFGRRRSLQKETVGTQ
jgi:O-antigen ligase